MSSWEKELRGLQKIQALDFVPIIWKFNEPWVLAQDITELLKAPVNPSCMCECLLVLESKK